MAKLDGLQAVLEFLQGLQPKVSAQISCYAFRFTVETREEGRGKREEGKVILFDENFM
jgi:hypothetical protein